MVTAEFTGSNNRKKSLKDAVYSQPEDNHKIIIAKRGKVFKYYRFKQELKKTFLFLRKTEEVETLGKNCKASSHSWQLQEKI